MVAASRQDIWKLLIDPVALASMTPFLKRIVPDGDHWRWEMTGLDVAGKRVSPCFTEKMAFTEGERIEFHHDPPSGSHEWSAVEGWYDLSDAGTPDKPSTHLKTSLEISLNLPLPKAAGPAVRATMNRVIKQMGHRFSHNLLKRLGVS